MSFSNQLKGFLKEKLPKQSAPVMRSVERAPWISASSVESAAVEDCYHLTGLGRQMCIAHYKS